HRRRIGLVGVDAFHRLLEGGLVKAALIGAEGEIGRVRRQGARRRRQQNGKSRRQQNGKSRRQQDGKSRRRQRGGKNRRHQRGGDAGNKNWAAKIQAEASARSSVACACATLAAGPPGSAKIAAPRAMNSAPDLAKAST